MKRILPIAIMLLLTLSAVAPISFAVSSTGKAQNLYSIVNLYYHTNGCKTYEVHSVNGTICTARSGDIATVTIEYTSIGTHVITSATPTPMTIIREDNGSYLWQVGSMSEIVNAKPTITHDDSIGGSYTVQLLGFGYGNSGEQVIDGQCYPIDGNDAWYSSMDFREMAWYGEPTYINWQAPNPAGFLDTLCASIELFTGGSWQISASDGEYHSGSISAGSYDGSATVYFTNPNPSYTATATLRFNYCIFPCL